ncbi:MAG: GNAT family N-acetyltransferase [Clostridiales Family XIII bacterium]|nr:GNAT family N-acetyltransferase [Clostridiales Family XIII bacterium]
MADFIIRPAERRDCKAILDLIKGLAEYEKMLEEFSGTPELLEKWLFDEPVAEVLVPEVAGQVVGYAIFFHSFSTFLTKPGIYLEDVYVEPEFRGRGIGKALLSKLASIVIERGYGRLEWACLDWNKPSMDLYLSLGAVPLDGWTTLRLTGTKLEELSKSCHSNQAGR